MGSKSKTLSDLLIHQLRDLHYAERHGAKLLGKLARAAASEEVRSVLDGLGQKAHGHVEQLDSVFDQLDKRSHSVPCEAMQGIIEEAKELLHAFDDSAALDAGLIASAQAVVHYGIARCSSISTWARQLNLDTTTSIVAVMLTEKRQSLEALDRLAGSASLAADGAADIPPPLTLKTAALSGLA